MASLASAVLNELVYPYLKLRKDFGRQPRFVEKKLPGQAKVFKPNKHQRKRFKRIRLLDRASQAVKSQSETPMNTIRRLRIDVGITHVEGGWPKDVNLVEPDAVIRQRKKMEKEENFQLAIPVMCKLMQKNILQNNSIELYQEHFKRKWRSNDKQKLCPRASTVTIFRDWTKLKRPIRKIDWSPNNLGRMVVSHFPRVYSDHLRGDSANCYIWEVENSTRPEAMIRSYIQVTDLHFHPKDYHSICASCYDGTVQFWDTRVQSGIIACSPVSISHKKPAMGCTWISSKTNTELMSVGLDGQVIWWDVRNLEETLDQTWLDPEKGHCREEMALPATIVEYEFTLPTKFIVGTWDGHIMVLMKKGKTPVDRLLQNYKGHIGPVHALKRNPMFIKNVLTVGDSTFRVFAEDCRESSCMWSKPRDELYTHGAWVPSRPSVFGCTRDDGRVEMWDILRNTARPFYLMKVCKIKLTHFAPGPSPVRLAAVGTDLGEVYLQKLSFSLSTFEKKDKPRLAAVFEREAHKEKNIEQKHREIRLRKRDKDKKLALQEKINKERQEFREKVQAEAKAAGKKVEKYSYPIFRRGKKFDLRFEAKHGEQCLYEKQFFKELDKEMLEKGLNAWEEFMEVVEEVKPDETAAPEEVTEVTASDLLLNGDDDDQQPRTSTAQPPPPNNQQSPAPPPNNQQPPAVNTQQAPPENAQQAQSKSKQQLPSESDQPPTSESDQPPPSDTDVPPISDTDQPPPSSSDPQPPSSDSDQTPPSDSDQQPPSDSEFMTASDSDQPPTSDSDQQPPPANGQQPPPHNDQQPPS